MSKSVYWIKLNQTITHFTGIALKSLFNNWIQWNSGPGSSVGIATGYGLEVRGSNSGFGGLGVCVLVSGTQDRGFAPDRSSRIFPAGKIHSMQYDTIQTTHTTIESPIPGQWSTSYGKKKILVGARFSAPVKTGPGAHPASCTMGTGSFPRVESGWGVTLTPHPLLVPWSK
jgi:hypothetical protein